ncbi:MAG: flagellar FliJ family protein [Rhodobacteraceae bacterium]|nr:flagellar FliJ family protein [Paracoccaceae bacterium]
MAKKKDLHTLIRLRKWDVDEKRRALGVHLREEERVLGQMQALEDSLARERAFVASAAPDQRMTFEAFVRRCRAQREMLERQLAEVRARIEVARQHLAETYRRLKTFEITQEQRDIAERKEEAHIEQMGLDEIGLTLFRRKDAGAAL